MIALGDALSCRLARTDDERAGYFALRREIFCQEQGLFDASDADAHDAYAYPIICAEPSGRVVGVVRIWEEPGAPGAFWGGRLGVRAEQRSAGGVGRALVQTAVGTARAWGATSFHATVQKANVPFFRRLHWRSLGELELAGQPHHLMQAELERYQPLPAARPWPTPELTRVRAA